MARGARPAPLRDQHPAGGRLPISRFAGQRRVPRVGSAFDAGAGATERDHLADLRRHRTQPGAGAAAVRYRALSRSAARTARRQTVAVALPGRLPPRRPVPCRPRRLRRDVLARARRRRRHAAADLRQAGRGADHRLDPDLRPRRSRAAARASRSRRWRRNFPDMRRFIREGYVRYAFTRFGVPYVVSIQCLDSTPRARRLACREAYPVAERFLKALRIAGGQPSRPRMDIASEIAERPDGGFARLHLSPERRHHRPQRRAQAWRPRRPHRLFANPLSAGKSPGLRQLAIVRQARQSGERSGAYPWRDNFCEARSFEVGQCAAGFGHQGQDIRPAPCLPNGESGSAAIPGSRPSSPSATAS